MDWLKSVKSFIFIVHLHVQGNDNHHEGTDSLWLASPPIYQRRRFFSTRYESRAQPSFPWISSNPSTDLMIPRRTKEKSMKPSSSSSSSSLLVNPIRWFIEGEGMFIEGEGVFIVKACSLTTGSSTTGSSRVHRRRVHRGFIDDGFSQAPSPAISLKLHLRRSLSQKIAVILQMKHMRMIQCLKKAGYGSVPRDDRFISMDSEVDSSGFSTGFYQAFMILDLAVNNAGALGGKRLLVDATNARTVQSLEILIL
ncbi:hypothetical protein F2Q70_00031602 [Brassica cretica]|uniref:Uncharacterized protein n=1 Tax=Brassica cretica TaxID=69181 RepID=A0A8S9FMS5_BRACR|nr:hypothetical protein F2Q70_00031602 [Brassica cretica]